MVVYNLGPGLAPADAYSLSATSGTGGNIARISALNPAPGASPATVNDTDLNAPVRTVTLAGNPFAQQAVAMASPLQRFQVVSGPVGFYCAKNTDGRLALWRAWDYPITAAQALPAGGKRALVATGLSTCDNIFDYSSAAAQRTGLVRIALSLLGRTDKPATIRLVHQVHVDNTP